MYKIGTFIGAALGAMIGIMLAFGFYEQTTIVNMFILDCNEILEIILATCVIVGALIGSVFDTCIDYLLE